MISKCFVALLALGIFGGCTQIPKEFTFISPATRSEVVWPKSPENARYKFIGYLTGEDNFSLSKASKVSQANKMLRWIAGLGNKTIKKDNLVRPQSGTSGADGRIFVSDVGSNSIFVFDMSNGVHEKWTQAESFRAFQAPIGVTSTNGFVFVADAELGAVYKLNLKGEPVGKFHSPNLKRPTGLAIDPASEQLFVADSAMHNIKVFSLDGNIVKTIGGPGTTVGLFNGPTHLTFTNDLLYVTDSLNARVQIFDAQGRFIRSLGERGLYIGNMSHPKGVTSDSSGNIYVTESFYDYLLIYSPAGEFLLSIGGRGRGVGDFFLPAGIWTDQSDRIYIADMLNGRVMVLEYLGESLREW